MESRGRYELLRCLGRGGMAEVFLARFRGPHGFERMVVVKRVLPQLAKESVFVRRLIDEARVAARLHHENIVQVLELGDDRGMPFLALELVEGRDLFVVLEKMRARNERMPVPHVVTAVRGVLAALAHAHAQGVVHRDVSSSNVIVSYQGGVKLIDFGIARARDSLSLTRPGAVLGKAMYMSPEQQRGGALDGRSDVYAVGVLLHLMLANDGPALSSSGESVRVRDSVPASLRPLVAGALADDPRDRFTADAMLAALDAWTARNTSPTSSTALGAWMRALLPPDVDALASGASDEVTGTRSAVRPAEGHIDSSLASLVDGEIADGDHRDGRRDGRHDEGHDNGRSGASVLDAPPIVTSLGPTTVPSPLRALLATQETPQQHPPRERDPQQRGANERVARERDANEREENEREKNEREENEREENGRGARERERDARSPTARSPTARERDGRERDARERDAHEEPTRILAREQSALDAPLPSTEAASARDDPSSDGARFSNAPTAQIPIDDARTATATPATHGGTTSLSAPTVTLPRDASATMRTSRAPATPRARAPWRFAAALGVCGAAAVVVIVVAMGDPSAGPSSVTIEPITNSVTEPVAAGTPLAVDVPAIAPSTARDPVAPVASVEPVATPRKRITRGDRRDRETALRESQTPNPKVDTKTDTKSEPPTQQSEGELSVRTTPSGARVLVDGREVGITPLRRLLPVGAHEVTLIAPSGARRQLPISVRANKLSDVNIKLE